MTIVHVSIARTSKNRVRLAINLDRIRRKPGLSDEDTAIWALLTLIPHLEHVFGLHAVNTPFAQPYAAATPHVGVAADAIRHLAPNARLPRDAMAFVMRTRKGSHDYDFSCKRKDGTSLPLEAFLYTPIARPSTKDVPPLLAHPPVEAMLVFRGPLHQTDSTKEENANNRCWSVLLGVYDALFQAHGAVPEIAEDVLVLLANIGGHQGAHTFHLHTPRPFQLLLSNALVRTTLHDPTIVAPLPGFAELCADACPRSLAIGRALAPEVALLTPDAALTGTLVWAREHVLNPHVYTPATPISAHAEIVARTLLSRLQHRIVSL